MTVLMVLGTLLSLLAIACVWESRSGRRAWGEHLGSEAPTTAHAASAAKKGAAAVAASAFIGMEAGGDG